MTLIASDNFTRGDSPTSLGTATTGQVWTQYLFENGTPGPTFKGYGISSNQAIRFAAPIGEDGVNAYAVLEGQTPNASAKVTLVNPTLYIGRFGLTGRWAGSDGTSRVIVWWDRNTSSIRINVQSGTQGQSSIGPAITINDGDVLRLDCCGTNYKVYLNDVLQINMTYAPAAPLVGTEWGLYAQDSIIGGNNQLYDSFELNTLEVCASQSWDCDGGTCIDPGDGTGTYSTLALCLASGCGTPPVTYNCVGGACVDPGDGSGVYATLAECEASGCGDTPTITTERFDAGTGSSWYIAPPITDSGDELRSKVVKAIRPTGKVTNCLAMVYGYDVSDPILTTDLEDGNNSSTGSIGVDPTTQVAQLPREQVNVPNAVLHTVRIAGDDTGQTTRDRVDEIVVEVAEQGVRR